MASSTPVSQISGLASGIQWQDMIDQIMTVETSRQLTPVTDRVTATQGRLDAWKGYQSVIGAVRDSAKAIADGTSFDKFNVSTSGATAAGRAILFASASSGAVPGAYRAEVLTTASAEKLGSSTFSDSTSALGITGTFLVSGASVTIDPTDSLSGVRDKINAVNTGATPSHVAASILTISSGVNRLILTNETSGSPGIELTENGGTSALSSLGLVSSTLVANTTPAGTTRSYGLTTVARTIAQALGVPMPMPSSFKVNGQTISVDLSQDSLTSILAKINAAAGANTASISSEAINGTTVSRIVVNGSVSVNGADAANSTATLQQLGFLKNQRGGEAQTIRTGTALTDSSTSLPATAVSLLTNLGASTGDTLTFSGTRTDGSSVSVGVLVDGSTTMQDVLDAISANGTGFGVAGHGVSASVDAQGRIQVTDSSTGESKVTFNAANDDAGGGTLDFGMTSVSAVGRSMQLATPSDAQIRIDGVLVTRSTNVISDALAGVTLNLQNAEAGTLVDLNVSRDSDSVVTALKGLVTSYNAAASYVTKNTAADGPLPLDNSIRSTIASLRSALIGRLPGLSNATYTNAALVGLTLDKTGKMTLDESALKTALASKPNEVKALFTTLGTSPSSSLQYMSATSNTKAGTYAVAVTSPATMPDVTSNVLGGAYANAAIANQMLVTDSFTGQTSTIALANGDTTASIVDKLNIAFGSNGSRITAAESGGAIRLTGANYGSVSTIAVAFQLDGTAAAAQFGFPPLTAGTDVVGTINGKSATGAGQLLTADAPAVGDTNDAYGLSVLYTGTLAASSTITYVRGLGGAFTDVADPIARAGTGTIDITTTALQGTIDALTSKEDDVQTRLDRYKDSLTAQFTAMESAMSKLNTQSQWLTGQINSLSGLNK